MFHLLPGPVRVGNADAHGLQTVGLVIEAIILFPGQLVDAIDAQAVKRVAFVHRNVFDPAIDKPGTGEEQPGPGVFQAAGLQHLEVPLAIDIQVQERLDVAVHVTHLPGQIENIIVAGHHPPHQFQVPDITLDELNLIENALEIKPVAPIQGQHGVQNADPGPLGHRQMGDGAADHAGAAGDQHPGAFESSLSQE